MTARRQKRRGFRPLDENETLRLTFHGAAGEVTGSCLLLETRNARVLIDCGLIQGAPQDERRNARRFPFDPAGLDAAVLTHAHIDHSGRLPKLVKDGFRGPIITSSGTSDLLEIMLLDSAHIQEGDARHKSRRLLRQGKAPVEPLYTSDDAQRALEQRAACALLTWRDVAPGVRVRFRCAGHILGATSVELDVEDEGVVRRIVISGDVGRAVNPLLCDPDAPTRADLLVLESTYGDRDHRSNEETLTEFASVLDDAARANANVIVPVFAVGRAQEILYHLGCFERDGRIAARPVFLDSPMAISVTELYARHRDSLAPEVLAALERGEQLAPAQLHFCHTPEQSMALNERRGIVILAASGMCNAGRVVHHLKHNLWRRGAHVVIVGFQARGTTGRALVDGARKVRLMGETIAVQAKLHTVGGFSAHAGKSELVQWSRAMLAGGARVALVHGEPDRRAALRSALGAYTKHPVWTPMPGALALGLRRGERFTLEGPEQDD